MLWPQVHLSRPLKARAWKEPRCFRLRLLDLLPYS